MITRLFFFFLLIANFDLVFSQGITGTWEGKIGHEFIQINIREEKGRICGYTMDHFLDNRREYCKAYFSGWYDPQNKEWQIRGTNFIENSGTHVLMYITLWRRDNNKNILGANISTSPGSSGINTILTRVSPWPEKLPGMYSVCYEEPKRIPPPRKPSPVVPKPINPKPAAPRPPVTKPPAPKPANPKPPVASQKPKTAVKPVPKQPDIVKPKIADSIKKKPAVPVAIIKPIPADKKLASRKRAGISTLQVKVKKIKLEVYDNGIIDGDTVSIFYNGKMLVNRKVLSAKPLVFDLEIDERLSSNEVIMYAENLGSIPPNTALLIVTAGDKRYELHSSATLETNAVLAFEYKPD